MSNSTQPTTKWNGREEKKNMMSHWPYTNCLYKNAVFEKRFPHKNSNNYCAHVLRLITWKYQSFYICGFFAFESVYSIFVFVVWLTWVKSLRFRSNKKEEEEEKKAATTTYERKQSKATMTKWRKNELINNSFMWLFDPWLLWIHTYICNIKWNVLCFVVGTPKKFKAAAI